MSKPPTIGENICAFIGNEIKTREEILKGVPGKRPSKLTAFKRLVDRGDVVEVEPDKFRLRNEHDDRSPAENPRGEVENTETINKLLNLYDIVLDNCGATIKKELSSKATLAEKIDLIKSLRWLGATVDQLMKRWYLVHRGYDSNTRQAQEDAKAKARKVEKEEVAGLPPEERVVVVGEYDDVMKRLWDDLPEAEKEQRTV